MLYRFLTLQEANAFLPLVRERFSKLQALVVEGQLLQEKVKYQRNLKTPKEQPEHGLESASESQEIEALEERIHAIEQEIRNDIVQLGQWGIVVRSVFPPKVNFLAKRHQQPVFLSWKKGERKVSHWHFLEDGFSMRQPVEDTSAFGEFVLH